MKHYEKRRSVSSKMFVMMLALVLVFGCAVGGTIAWLVTKTDPVVNTFTYGDINIELKETTGNNYKIIPGVDIKKDPKVTVLPKSEACWLFVKVEEEGEFALSVTYKIADGWTQLVDNSGKNVDGVYYREVNAKDAQEGVSYYVLKGNDTYPEGVISVDSLLTKTAVNNIKTQPKLTFTAYAVQRDSIDDVNIAWNNAKIA